MFNFLHTWTVSYQSLELLVLPVSDTSYDACVNFNFLEIYQFIRTVHGTVAST